MRCDHDVPSEIIVVYEAVLLDTPARRCHFGCVVLKNRTDDVDLIFGREIYGSRNAALKLIK
jgi:hypothetical protein